MRVHLVLALLILLVLPGAAHAATVRQGTYEIKRVPDLEIPALLYTAEPGEKNALEVDFARTAYPAEIRFRDKGAPVTAGADCTQIDKHTATCREVGQQLIRLGGGADTYAVGLDGTQQVQVYGGAGDDVIRAGTNGRALASTNLRGGAGDDRLIGGSQEDAMRGGPGRDRMLGGGNIDHLYDGERPGQHARDTMDGGPGGLGGAAGGQDYLEYGNRTDGLRIDLGKRTTSTEDRIKGFESVVGGSGRDVLLGSNGSNVMRGGGGRDVVRGRGGSDNVIGGKGDDRVYGGASYDEVAGEDGADVLRGGSDADTLYAGSGDDAADNAGCGSGTDTVYSGSDDVIVGCETLSAFGEGGLTLSTVPRLVGDTAVFDARCGFYNDDCASRLTLTGSAGQAYGATDFAVASSETPGTVTVAVPLTEAGKAALRRTGTTLVVDISSMGTSSAGYRVKLP